MQNLIRKIKSSRFFSWLKGKAKAMHNGMRMFSFRKALAEQKLLLSFRSLTQIIPDLSGQYTALKINTPYLTSKVRAMHAFQVSLIRQALMLVEKLKLHHRITVVDIGDSAGSHIQYIKKICTDKDLHCLSVNMEAEAVEKIKSKGLEAVCSRAEDLVSKGINADIFLSFEMLEHLMDPINFLKNLADKTTCSAFVITVPYVSQSRAGLSHIRRGARHQKVGAETTHIFELCPEDWKLLFRHAGWKVVAEKKYLQYPRRSIFTPFLKQYWKRFDYEGFYGVILSRDNSWSRLYSGW